MFIGITLLRTNIYRAIEQRRPVLLAECLDQIEIMPVPTTLEEILEQNQIRQQWWRAWLALDEDLHMMEVRYNRLPVIPGAVETLKDLKEE